MAYSLTPKGKNVAEHSSRVRDAEGAFLAYLYEHVDPIEIEELIGETRIDDEIGLRTINRLITKGYVKEVHKGYLSNFQIRGF